jgi:hypothetical protein
MKMVLGLTAALMLGGAAMAAPVTFSVTAETEAQAETVSTDERGDIAKALQRAMEAAGMSTEEAAKRAAEAQAQLDAALAEAETRSAEASRALEKALAEGMAAAGDAAKKVRVVVNRAAMVSCETHGETVTCKTGEAAADAMPSENEGTLSREQATKIRDALKRAIDAIDAALAETP